MEEPEKHELSTCGTSESSLTHCEKVDGKTLEDFVVQMDGSFSEEFVGEGGACNGKDVMVEVLGSDVYIDGVCTRGSDAELNEEVGCGGSVEGSEDLGEDMKPAGLGSGTEARFEGSQCMGSEEGSENPATKLGPVLLETEERGRAVAGNDNRPQKDVGTGVSDSVSAVNTTSLEIEVPTIENVGVQRMNALNAGVPDCKVTSSRCDITVGHSLIVSSVGGENVQSRCAEKDDQLELTLVDHVETEDKSDLALRALHEQNNISNWHSSRILEKEACICYKVEFRDKLNSYREQPMVIDEVGGKSNTVQKKIVAGAEVAVDKALLNSEEKKCCRLEKCIEKEQMTDTSQVSSDTGQAMEVDRDFHAEDFAILHVKQNAENFERVDGSTNRDDQVCNTGQITSINNEGLQGTSLSFGTSEENLDTSTISGIAEEDTHSADQGHFTPVGAGRKKLHNQVPLSVDDQKSEFMTCVHQSVTSDDAQVESNINNNVEVQAGISEQAGSYGGQEIEVEKFSDADGRKTIDGEVIKCESMKPGGSSGILYQSSYLFPAEKEGEFSVSDMVWGKVRSHPWWPGQIFYPSDASEKAMKHYKKDCFLVVYFGDRTFAWNEASQLRPFWTHFSSIEKQSTSESFQNAVDSALDEVTRRVEFGLACHCLPKDTYDAIKFQIVENTGIRQELSFRDWVDESLTAFSFSSDKLIKYLKTLSEFPTGAFDRLELVIAKAQLLAFYRLKGYSCLSEFQYCGGLDDDTNTLVYDGEKNSNEAIDHASPVGKNDCQAGTGNLKSQNSSRYKCKHNLKDGKYLKKKERSLLELMGGTLDSPEGDHWSDEKVTDDLEFPTLSKKRRTLDHCADDSEKQDGRKTISLAKVSKKSFKIGECIPRVASQLTGSPSMLKCSAGERSQKTDGTTDGYPGNGSYVSFQNVEEDQSSSVIVLTEYSSLDDFLSSLQWVAQEPLRDNSFLNAIVGFFSDFRNSITVADDSWKILPIDKVSTKRKKPSIAGLPGTFEFEDMSDTYWTDRVIGDGSEEQPSRRKRKKDYQHDPAEPEKPVQVIHRPYSRKRYSDNNHAEAPEKPSGYVNENSPAELVMNFAELDYVPSETNLNKMFRRFGPLKESETEVDRVSSRARVVFKKCADAEVACSSAKKFNIFGSILVNYQLNYTPSALFKVPSVSTTQDQEMHFDLSNFEDNSV